MKGLICAASGCIGATVAYAFGGWDAGIKTLILFMVIDYGAVWLWQGSLSHLQRRKQEGLRAEPDGKGYVVSV